LNWGGGREGKGRGGGWAINLVLGTTTERARYKLLYLSLLFIYLFIYLFSTGGISSSTRKGEKK
jgi:hypothetical protein